MLPSGVKQFGKWWLQQLGDLLPFHLFAPKRDIVLVDLSRPESVVSIRSSDATRLAARASSDDDLRQLVTGLTGDPSAPKALMLRVASSDALIKRLSYPIAVQHRLDELIGFELDRETPFSDAESYWNYLIDEKDRQFVTVCLAVVPRRRVAALLDRASAAGLKPEGLYVEVRPGLGITLELAPQSHWRKIQVDRSRVVITAVAAALTFLALALPFGLQALAFHREAALEAALDTQAAEAGALRHSLDSLRTSSDFMTRKQAAYLDPLQVLANTTEVLPDDSYLTALTLHGARLTITGASPASAKLIPLLAASGYFKDPAFDGPVLQSDSGALETFTITVTSAPGGPS